MLILAQLRPQTQGNSFRFNWLCHIIFFAFLLLTLHAGLTFPTLSLGGADRSQNRPPIRGTPPFITVFAHTRELAF